MQIIKVENIRSYAYHGCLPQETKIGAPYETDIHLWYDFSQAAATDDLTLTINYVDVNKIVEEEMAIASQLIETVAHRIKQRLRDSFEGITQLMIEIRKINPPLEGDVSHVAVRIEE